MSSIERICLSPNGQLLYVLCAKLKNRYEYESEEEDHGYDPPNDYYIDVLNVSDGSLDIRFHLESWYHLSGVSASNELFMVNDFGHVKVLDVTDGSIRFFENRSTSVGYSRRRLCIVGESLYVADNGEKCIYVFNADGTYIQRIGVEGWVDPERDVHVMLVSPGGEIFLTNKRDIHVHHLTDGTYIRSIVPGAHSEITLSPDGEFLFVDDPRSGKIKMLRAANGTLVQEIGVNSIYEVSSMCVSPDGGELFVAYQTGRIKVFKL